MIMRGDVSWREPMKIFIKWFSHKAESHVIFGFSKKFTKSKEENDNVSSEKHLDRWNENTLISQQSLDTKKVNRLCVSH